MPDLAMPAAHINQNALRSNLPQYQRLFFPAGNDNPSSVLKTILSTRVAPKGCFCAVGSRSKTGAPGAPLRMMDGRWSEGEEEEWTQDLPLRSAGSAWPPCPTSIVEVFRDLGHFLMLPQALQFYLGWKFSTDGFCALTPSAAGQCCPQPSG